jgi:hypothetical protein
VKRFVLLGGIRFSTLLSVHDVDWRRNHSRGHVYCRPYSRPGIRVVLAVIRQPGGGGVSCPLVRKHFRSSVYVSVYLGLDFFRDKLDALHG